MASPAGKENIAPIGGLGLLGVDFSSQASPIIVESTSPPQPTTPQLNERPAWTRADCHSPSVKPPHVNKPVVVASAADITAELSSFLKTSVSSPHIHSSPRLRSSPTTASLRAGSRAMPSRTLTRSPLITNLEKIKEIKENGGDTPKLQSIREKSVIEDDPDAQGEVDNNAFIDRLLSSVYRDQSNHFFAIEAKRSASTSYLHPPTAIIHVRSFTEPIRKPLASKTNRPHETPTPKLSSNGTAESLFTPRGEKLTPENMPLIPAPLSIRRAVTDSPPPEARTSLITPSGTVMLLPTRLALRSDSGIGGIFDDVDGDEKDVVGGGGKKLGSDGGQTPKAQPPSANGTPQFSYSHRFIRVLPNPKGPHIEKHSRSVTAVDIVQDDIVRDKKFYFTAEERLALHELVYSSTKHFSCHHPACRVCIDLEFCEQETKALPLTMAPEDRSSIIANNRSLRTIKNELENLLSKAAISDEAYDTIMRTLPDEKTFRGQNSTPPTAPTAAFNNLRVSNNEPPPAYNKSPSGPPALPNRGPSAPPSKPEIAKAVALYQYVDAEGGMSFEPYDQLVVFAYTNADWWDGKNVRTGVEGIFPSNHVQLQQLGNRIPATPNEHHAAIFPTNEKQNYGGYAPQQQYQAPQQYSSAPPPGPSNPYDSSAPPMAIANQPAEAAKPSKGSEMGKKMGKKMGDAALFGAGATLGSKIINGIF